MESRRVCPGSSGYRAGWLRAGTAGLGALMAGGLLLGGGATAYAEAPALPGVLTGGLQSMLASVQSGLSAVVAQQVPVPAVPVPAMAAPVPPAPGPGSLSSQGSPCVSALTGSVEPFEQHLKFAHLERSLPDQMQDIQNANQYVLTHTVLVQTMASPVQAGISKILSGTLAPFFTHLKFAHLERSPFNQVEDIKAADQYIKTHTALVETMSAPATEVLGGCGSPAAQPPHQMPMP